MKLNRTREEWAKIKPDGRWYHQREKMALEDLAALFAEVERLRGALKPFAPPDWTMQVVRNGTENDDAELGNVSVSVPGSEREWRWSFAIADLETARQALQGDTHD